MNAHSWRQSDGPTEPILILQAIQAGKCASSRAGGEERINARHGPTSTDRPRCSATAERRLYTHAPAGFFLESSGICGNETVPLTDSPLGRDLDPPRS